MTTPVNIYKYTRDKLTARWADRTATIQKENKIIVRYSKRKRAKVTIARKNVRLLANKTAGRNTNWRRQNPARKRSLENLTFTGPIEIKRDRGETTSDPYLVSLYG